MRHEARYGLVRGSFRLLRHIGRLGGMLSRRWNRNSADFQSPRGTPSFHAKRMPRMAASSAPRRYRRPLVPTSISILRRPGTSLLRCPVVAHGGPIHASSFPPGLPDSHEPVVLGKRSAAGTLSRGSLSASRCVKMIAVTELALSCDDDVPAEPAAIKTTVTPRQLTTALTNEPGRLRTEPNRAR